MKQLSRREFGGLALACWTAAAALDLGHFVAADGDRRQPWNTNWTDLQPRTGYGLSFLPLNGTGGNGGVVQTGYARRTPFVATIGGGLNSYIPGLPGTGTFANPFPNGILEPYGPGLGPKTQLGQAAANITRAQSLSAFPQFTAVTRNGDSLGNTSYNALEMRFT
ncbi:MAG: hypothetical protein AAB225_06940 [Acidobacteriota bacterium]